MKQASTDPWDRLREAIHAAPSRSAFESVVGLLSGWRCADARLAEEYAARHMEGWPGQLCAVPNPEVPAWRLARHLDLAWQGQRHDTLTPAHARALAAAAHIRHLSLAAQDLPALTAAGPLPHIQSLTVTDDVDAPGPRMGELGAWAEFLPSVTELSLLNCANHGPLALHQFTQLRRVRVVGGEGGSVHRLDLPRDLRRLELSAVGEPWELEHFLDIAVLPNLTHLTLSHCAVYGEMLERAAEFPSLTSLDLGTSRLQDPEQLPDDPLVSRALSEPSALRAQQARALANVGSWSMSEDGGGGGESCTLVVEADAHQLLFQFAWGGYWVGYESADSDNYEASGEAYAIRPDLLLLIIEEEEGHVSPADDAWPYARFGPDGICETLHPDTGPGQYDGPFGLHLARDE